MIQRLNLTGGRFAGKDIDFAGVTVVLGPNESGKTTLHDGLVSALCPKINGRHPFSVGRKSRYGENFTAIGTFEPPVPPQFDIDLVQSVLSVRSGQVTLNMAGDWFDSLKSSLLTQGLDLEPVLADLRKASSDKGNTALGKSLLRCQEEIKGTQTKLDDLGSQLAQARQKELLAQNAGSQLLGLAKQIGQLETRYQELITQIKTQEELSRLDEARRALGYLERHRELRQSLGALNPTGPQVLAEEAALRGKIEEATQHVGRLRERLAEKSRSLEGAENLLATQRGALAEREAQGAAARDFSAHLAAYRQPKREVRGIRWPLLIFALALSLGGLVAGGLGYALHQWATAGVGGALLFIGVVLALASRWKNVISDDEDLKKTVLSIEERYRTASKDEGARGLSDPLALQQFFERKRAEWESLRAQVQATETAWQGAQGETSATQRALDQGVQALTEAKESHAQALSSWGVKNRDDLVKQTETRKSMEGEFEKVTGDLQRICANQKCQDLVALRAEMGQRLESEGARRLEGQVGDRALLDRLRAELEIAGRELEKRRAEREQLNREEAGVSGRAQTLLETLLPRVFAEEEKMARLQRELSALHRERQGAELALSVMEEVARQNTQDFSALAGEVGELFAKAGLSRKMAMPVLSGDLRALEKNRPGEPAMEDVTGVLRPVHALSQGTGDLFALGCRLALCHRVRSVLGHHPILVLDDPFLSMDETRQKIALELLKTFRGKGSWQVVLFTKEPGLAHLAKETLGATLVTL